MEIDRRRVRRLIEKSRTQERALNRVIRRQAWLDPVADAVQKAVGAFYGALGAPGRSIKNVMHGTAVLGHPLHPALTDVPIGAWTVGVIADWLFVATGRVPALAGDLALAVGVAGAILAAVTGYTDFHETEGHERRTAIVQRGMIIPCTAIALSSGAWVFAVGGAYVGGHLTFGLGSAVNHNAFPFEGPSDFVRVGTRSDFPEGEMRRVEANGLPVAIRRRNGLLHAIGAVCAHAGGPLEEGKLEGEVVQCPWHGSRFRFGDGRVVDGPATFDQPLLEVRERGGVVEIKLAHPLR